MLYIAVHRYHVVSCVTSSHSPPCLRVQYPCRRLVSPQVEYPKLMCGTKYMISFMRLSGTGVSVLVYGDLNSNVSSSNLFFSRMMTLCRYDGKKKTSRHPNRVSRWPVAGLKPKLRFANVASEKASSLGCPVLWKLCHVMVSLSGIPVHLVTLLWDLFVLSS